MATFEMLAFEPADSVRSTMTTTSRVPLTRKRVLYTVGADGKRRLAREASSSNELAMENYQGTIYFMDVSLDGSTFVVQVDTGSSDLWISCYYVSGVTCSSSCPTDASVISYGSGDVCVEGTYADLVVGSVTVNNYVVGIAQGSNVQPSSSSSLLAGDAQGLFGLAYSGLATLPTTGGQFIDYVSSFSMYLTQEDGSDGSFLLLNGVDDDLISKNSLMGYTVPLKTALHWTIGMTALQIGNDTAVFPCSTASSGSCDAIVDSGTSLLAMPYSIYKDFVSTYLTPNGCEEYSSGTDIYMCDSSVDLPRLAFTFSDVTFYLEKEDYIIEYYQGVNIVEVQPTSTSGSSYANTWIIGETFLKMFYTSYNVNESVTFYCQNGTTCTPGSQAVDIPESSDSSGDATDGDSTNPYEGIFGGSGSRTSSSTNTSSGDSNDHLKTILLIVIGVLAFFVIVAVVSWFFRCLRSRRRRREANGLEPAVVVNGAYYPATALTPHRGYN